ncbi:unnamed protein product, partial [Didymodactylos carnosus]
PSSQSTATIAGTGTSAASSSTSTTSSTPTTTCTAVAQLITGSIDDADCPPGTLSRLNQSKYATQPPLPRRHVVESHD